ncbi:MAG TPA: molecular chaperone DnaJ [bacterium]|nr:molecular chaperone DnaJ [bacterium]
MSKDYYKILGVEKNATESDIKKAFSKLAHKYHPDKAGGDEAKFKEINEAYQVLKDKEKRQKYDQFGSDFSSGFSGGGNPFGGGFNWQDFSGGQGFNGFSNGGVEFDFGDIGDIFGDFFGGSRRSSRRNSRGRDIQTEIQISFEESVFGIEKHLRLNKKIICDKCDGKGGTNQEKCKKCNGSGKVTVQQQTFFGNFASVTMCPDCDGSGSIFKETCSKCHGSGSVNGSEEIKVKIPGGIADGQTIRLSGKGESGSKGSQSGDLYIIVRVSKSSKFERVGDDIHSIVKLKYSQLIKGDKILVDTIDGEVKLKIPEFTPSGKVFILHDKGVTKLNSRGRGDHHVKVILDVPKYLDREQKKLIEELEKRGL